MNKASQRFDPYGSDAPKIVALVIVVMLVVIVLWFVVTGPAPHKFP